MQIQTRLKAAREQAGLSAASLASRAGISRQTIHAIEAGAYIPNTAVSLLLARELGVSVEDLFSLPSSTPDNVISAIDAFSADFTPGQPVLSCRVGDKSIAVPAVGARAFLPGANAIVAESSPARLRVRSLRPAGNSVLIAGCDPGLSVIAEILDDVVLAPATSRESVRLLREGMVHIAGMHLRDDLTGDYNVPMLKQWWPRTPLHVTTFASWQEGILLAKGNPHEIRTIADLASRGVSIVNRPKGAGSRELLDRLLADAGIAAHHVRGYDRTVPDHMSAASAVARGDADASIATESVARLFGLAFVPLVAERFDLVTLRKNLAIESVQAVFDALTRGTTRQKLQALAGYDVSETGCARV